MSTTVSNALAGGNICFGKAGMAAGTTTTTTVTTATNYSIRGQMYTLAAGSNGATPTTDAVTGAAFLPLTAGKSCIFVYCADTAGALKIVQGPLVNGADVTGKLAAVHFPVVPVSLTAVGYLYAQAGSTLVSTWTLGVNNMSGVTGMTYTIRDLATVPAQPITA